MDYQINELIRAVANGLVGEDEAKQLIGDYRLLLIYTTIPALAVFKLLHKPGSYLALRGTQNWRVACSRTVRDG
jgi:hypothetical protein